MLQRATRPSRDLIAPGTFARSPVASAMGLLFALAVAAPQAHADSFSIGSGTSSTAQSLAGNQTGTISAGASLSVGGGSVAVTVTGSNATLTNLGTLAQTGTGRAIRDNTGVNNLRIFNGSATHAAATIRTADADVIQMNRSPASVTLDNYGQMLSLNASGGGNQVVDFSAIGSGANVVYNRAGALMRANEADAVRPGVGGVVHNWGTIQSVTGTGSSSDAIDAQANSGISLHNHGTGVVDGARHGITGGPETAGTSFTMGVTNEAGGIIQGRNGSGLNFDGFDARQLITVVNHGTITGQGVTGDGDGVDVDGAVHITNTGVIRSINSFGSVASGLAFSEAISVGGGSIVNSGLIEGLVAPGNGNAVGRGISLVGNDITAGANAGKREALYADAVVTNRSGGIIRGDSESAVYVGGLAGSGRTVTLTNEAGGTLRGGGTGAAAIVVASDYDTTVHNAGLIDGSSSGRALLLGSGRNTVTIAGAQAQVLGDMNGGSGAANVLHLEPGAGNSFAYAGAIAGFQQVTVHSGTVVLSGASSYTGTTTVEAGATLALEGVQRLSADSALQLAGGTLRMQGATGQASQTFASLSLSMDSTIDLGGSWLSFGELGSSVDGSRLTLLNHEGSSLYAIRFSGDLSTDTAFLGLMSNTTIDGLAVQVRFDGGFTNVSAVPEPGTWLLMLGGLSLVGWLASRRARQQPRAAALAAC